MWVIIIQCTCFYPTPQYLSSLNICGGRGFPVVGRESSGTFSRIHFRLASLAAMSHSSKPILLAARKPITSCCCFLICGWVEGHFRVWKKGSGGLVMCLLRRAIWGNRNCLWVWQKQKQKKTIHTSTLVIQTTQEKLFTVWKRRLKLKSQSTTFWIKPSIYCSSSQTETLTFYRSCFHSFQFGFKNI